MGRCIDPFVRKGTEQALPCGRCYECRARRVSNWSFRLLKEAEISDSAYFVTLTYAPEHVPRTKNRFKTLVKTDVQKFFKRFRKEHNGKPLKYYVCGEYGFERERPHYHIILFNAQLELLIGDENYKIFKNGFLPLNGKIEFTACKSWQYGYLTVGEVNPASVGYTLEYITKGRIVPAHKNDDRQKEFSLMSKGMGKNYLTSEMIWWHKKDILNRMYCIIPQSGGKKIAMPRYYRDKIYSGWQILRINNHIENQVLTAERKKSHCELEKDALVRIYKSRLTNVETRKTKSYDKEKFE